MGQECKQGEQFRPGKTAKSYTNGSRRSPFNLSSDLETSDEEDYQKAIWRPAYLYQDTASLAVVKILRD